jgi:phosphoribosylaminoimidazole-succinocarboxamide synthase
MSLKHVYSGKVRDIYEVDDDTLLFVASDRLSAFDVVMNEPVPDKGRVLTGMTAFWLDHLSHVAPSHLVTVDPAEFPDGAPEIGGVAGRGMVVRKAEMLTVECIVRGYLSGTAWKEYKASGTMHGQKLPAGLEESSQLPEPVFTPATKVNDGHDVNISFDEACEILGDDTAKAAREISLAAYEAGRAWAEKRGIIIADTKFELGFVDGKLAICDEVLTPDSSRFWPADQYVTGRTPPSFDKQPVRDWLDATDWDKTPPPPPLPPDVIAQSRERYVTAYERITGLRFDDWYGAGQ